MAAEPMMWLWINQETMASAEMRGSKTAAQSKAHFQKWWRQLNDGRQYHRLYDYAGSDFPPAIAIETDLVFDRAIDVGRADHGPWIRELAIPTTAEEPLMWLWINKETMMCFECRGSQSEAEAAAHFERWWSQLNDDRQYHRLYDHQDEFWRAIAVKTDCVFDRTIGFQ